MLAYPGTTLYSLEKALKPLGREPHSVIGSSCIGASVIGGICNNSGGSLVQRGPAYTEMSLFARINEDGKLTLVNHLGIDLGETPEQILSKLDDDRIKDDDVRHDGRHAHDYDYVHRVRDIEADTPARYNADPDRLFESSGDVYKRQRSINYALNCSKAVHCWYGAVIIEPPPNSSNSPVGRNKAMIFSHSAFNDSLTNTLYCTILSLT